MIARVWKGAAADRRNADAYVRHLRTNVIPELAVIPGHREVRLLRRQEGERTEFLVMTLWESMDAIRRFAGDDPERAVVEPEARALLKEYDELVNHYEVVQ